MADIQLSVSPETLRRTATEMTEVVKKIRLRAARIQDISNRTRGYWQGDAGSQDRAGYGDCGEELLEAARKVENRAVTLMKLAGVYEEVENKIGELNAGFRLDHILSR